MNISLLTDYRFPQIDLITSYKNSYFSARILLQQILIQLLMSMSYFITRPRNNFFFHIIIPYTHFSVKSIFVSNDNSFFFYIDAYLFNRMMILEIFLFQSLVDF